MKSFIFILLYFALRAALTEAQMNGKTAAEGKFPYVVQIHRRLGEEKVEFKCGGTIIDEHWILTAGHCLEDDEGNTA